MFAECIERLFWDECGAGWQPADRLAIGPSAHLKSTRAAGL
jgi:hypothetical protein